MKKNSDKLKSAFLEAAEVEITSLPEENRIIRPYSKIHETKMTALLDNEEARVKISGRPRRRITALIAAVILIVACMGTVGAVKNYMKIFSPEWRESIQESAKNATYSEDIEAFDEAFAKADDYFANLTRKTEGADNLLLDYSDAYDIDVKAEKDGYTFYIDKIVKGSYKANKVVSGSIFDGTAEFQWVVEEGYFLLAEITRTDGKKLTAEDDRYFDLSVVVAGFSPHNIQSALRGGYGISEKEEYGWYYAMSVDKAMVFAGYDLGLVATDNENAFMLDYDNAYQDENGLPCFREHIDGTNIVIGFNIDEKFADEKAAEKIIEEYRVNIGKDMYKK